MSIVTKTGDDGTTALMFNRRVPKTHPRIEACGAIDELNSALGTARATAQHDFVSDNLSVVQKDLVGLMGEIATAHEDAKRYAAGGFAVLTAERIEFLDNLAMQIESQNVYPKGWAQPGGSLSSANLDMARSVCRRAERSICAIAQEIPNRHIGAFLNRLSDVLWLLARWVDAQPRSNPS